MLTVKPSQSGWIIGNGSTLLVLMTAQGNRIWCWLMLCVMAGGGCRVRGPERIVDSDMRDYLSLAIEDNFQDVEDVAVQTTQADLPPPILIRDLESAEYQTMELREAVRLGIKNSTVFQDLSSNIPQVNEILSTVYDALIEESDGVAGVEAARSAFDAQVSFSSEFQNNERPLNNELLGGGSDELKQDTGVYQAQLSKLTPVGTQMLIRKIVTYDSNTAERNRFDNFWEVMLEGEIRQPLARGRGWDANMIGGPGSAPGEYRGVEIAKNQVEIALVRFEQDLRDLVSDIENAYWDLYFAYRHFDAKRRAVEMALVVYDEASRKQVFAKGVNTPENVEAQLRKLQAELYEAAHGSVSDPTRTNNGASGGVFRGNLGVLVAERNLRQLIGLPVNGGALVRPADEPTLARVHFDWREVMTEAAARRTEARQWRLQMQRHQLELRAARNQLLPQMDLVALSRWRGFGDDLIGDRTSDPFDNAFANLTSGDYVEAMLRFEMSFNAGFRREHAAVYNAQLRYARAQALLDNVESRIARNLSIAVSQADATYQVLEVTFNEWLAAKRHRDRLIQRDAVLTVDSDTQLQAIRQELNAETAFFRTLTRYMIDIKNIHFEKGSLFDYNDIAFWGSNVDMEAVAPASRQNLYYAFPQATPTPEPAGATTMTPLQQARFVPMAQVPSRSAGQVRPVSAQVRATGPVPSGVINAGGNAWQRLPVTDSPQPLSPPTSAISTGGGTE